MTVAKEITGPVTSALRPITEGVQKAVELVKYPSIKAAEEDDQDPNTSMLYIGEVTETYLTQFASKEEVDKNGLYDKNGEFFIGGSPIKIEGDDITVKDKVGLYQGTPGLWELLIMREPDKHIYNTEDFKNYAEILHSTNAMKHNHDPRL